MSHQCVLVHVKNVLFFLLIKCQMLDDRSVKMITSSWNGSGNSGFRILTIAAGLHNSAIHQYPAFTCLQRITILPYFVSQIWFPTMIQHKKH